MISSQGPATQECRTRGSSQACRRTRSMASYPTPINLRVFPDAAGIGAVLLINHSREGRAAPSMPSIELSSLCEPRSKAMGGPKQFFKCYFYPGPL
jgi:hypothetical protein